jgi:hypothetical protein
MTIRADRGAGPFDRRDNSIAFPRRVGSQVLPRLGTSPALATRCPRTDLTIPNLSKKLWPEAEVSTSSEWEERLLALWRVPPDSRDDPIADFSAFYADPTLINGTPIAVQDLVARARGLHAAFSEHQMAVVDRVVEEGKVAIAFRHSARQTGPWVTPVGTIEPTGRVVSGLGIDVLTVAEGRVTEIWVLADELQRLMQVTTMGATAQ